MTTLTWDDTGQRTYETGVDKGVLYIPNNLGVYDNGVAWNGLTTVTESPSGAESNPLYADNMKYLNLISAEQFGGTIEAYTYPDEFVPFDGTALPVPGVSVGQQNRRSFGFAYRSLLGNDVEGQDYGYKLHLVYGATASPSERAYATVNDSPEAITFSWTFETVPVQVTGMKPTAIITINSTDVDPAELAAFEEILYGTVSVDPALPLPDAVIAAFGGTALTVATPTAPSYNAGTHTITIPTVTGITYYADDVAVTGTIVLDTGESVVVVALTDVGYTFPSTPYDSDWLFSY